MLAVLAAFRPQVERLERHLVDRIAEALRAAAVPFNREVPLGRGRRIDLLVGGGLGIEVKKGKPDSAAVTRQVTRYCEADSVRELVLVVERNVFDVPEAVQVLRAGRPERKKVHYVAVNSQGGVAL